MPTHGEARAKERERRKQFFRARKAETTYSKQLRKIARHIGDLVRAFKLDNIQGLGELEATLNRYSDILDPWAKAVSFNMLAEVAKRDATAWNEYAKGMSLAVRAELKRTDVGGVFRRLQHEQVNLITSIPRSAAERVHSLSTKAVEAGGRGKNIVEDILATTEVSRSRAELIARTEVARAQANFTQVRAQAIGSTHYEWLTAGDSDVRKLHRKLNHKVFSWDDPPIIGEKGERGHPGTIFNCRCIGLPLI